MRKILSEIWNNLEAKEQEYLRTGFYLILILGFISIFLLPLILTREIWSFVNYNNSGAIGDTINGIAGPFIALIAAILTFIAFYIQYKANIQQRDQFKLTLEAQNIERSAQEKIWQIERFENKYFQLIQLHRDNVAEIAIGKIYGKKTFVLMVREFRCILKITSRVAQEQGLFFLKEQIFIISYYALFFGVGPNSSRMLKEALRDYNSAFVDAFEKALNDNTTKDNVKKDRGFNYTPFEGHQSRLGHYYRHLYQTVTYVDKQTIAFDKYEYVKTIRAQLTTHEQALLFINSLTPLGKAWLDNDLIIKYKFVKNIPHGFFNKIEELDLEPYFPKDYFELSG